MYPQHIQRTFLGLAAVWGLAAGAAFSAEPPSPTPTPRPGTLAETAGRITLNGQAAVDASGRIVISDDNLARLSERGTVSFGGTAAPRQRKSASKEGPKASVRARWRKRVLDQKQVIAGLERRRQGIEGRIDLIEEGRLTVGSLAKLQRAELDLRTVEEEIRRERLELRRLVREARSHGAEPGWFR